MGEVVDLAARRTLVEYEFREEDAETPYLSGPCKCLACQFGWVGVAPVGTVHLECPHCGADRGVFMGEVVPADGEVWIHQCGCDVFMLTRTDILCVGCGAAVTGWP